MERKKKGRMQIGYGFRRIDEELRAPKALSPRCSPRVMDQWGELCLPSSQTQVPTPGRALGGSWQLQEVESGLG